MKNMKTTPKYKFLLLLAAVVCFVSNTFATIHFMNFTVRQKESSAFLDWMSGEESEVDYFSVEKSLDGKFWFEITTLELFEKESNFYHAYYLDSNLADGVQYYRVKLQTSDGQSAVSEIQSFQLEREVYLKPELYPNPTSGAFVLKYTFQSEEPQFNIVTSRGKIVDIDPVNTVGLYTFDLTEFYPGVYFLQIIEGDKVTRVKVSKR